MARRLRRAFQPTLRTALEAVLWVPLLALVVFAVLPRLTPYDVLVVRGSSMQPAISVGSAVIIDRADRAPLVGAVATFRQASGDLVTHRIVGLDGSKIVTKGDANLARDVTERTAADLMGTVVVAVPYLGYVLYALRQPLVFFLLLVGTGGFLIAGELQAIVREIRRLRRTSTA